jgi:hypothetical protein
VLRALNLVLLEEHIDKYYRKMKLEKLKFEQEFEERNQRIQLFQSWTKNKIMEMDESELYKFLSPLWAMLIWGNKHYVIQKLIQDNGLDNLNYELAEFVWGNDSIETRWDNFRGKIKGFGPAMLSEILSHVYPEDYMIWNRRAYIGFNHLGVQSLPKYDYQCTGKKYKELCETAIKVAKDLDKAGFEKSNLLTVDYFIWDELQVESNVGKGSSPKNIHDPVKPLEIEEDSQFIHDEIRDKIGDIGQWLGFVACKEKKVADGSVVDMVWEATIGNMGRVIYVFEVQTKGSIDSLILNLLKSLNNPAVQGVVAVSNVSQLEKIKKHASQVQGLGSKLKYWDYKEVLDNHGALASVNESINKLGLVPQGF